MPYMPKKPLYFLRTSKSHYYSAGSGAYAVPKIYDEGAAKRVLRQKNGQSIHPTDGPWEAVPVTFVEGEPLTWSEK